MTNSQRLATVRARLLHWLSQQTNAAPNGQESENLASNYSGILRETMLIRDDFFVGRRFYGTTHHAIWFIEEDQLKIYQSDTGEVARVFSGEEIDLPASEATSGETENPMVIKMPVAKPVSTEVAGSGSTDNTSGSVCEKITGNDGGIRRAA